MKNIFGELDKPKVSKGNEYLSIDFIWFGGNHVEFHTSSEFF